MIDANGSTTRHIRNRNDRTTEATTNDAPDRSASTPKSAGYAERPPSTTTHGQPTTSSQEIPSHRYYQRTAPATAAEGTDPHRPTNDDDRSPCALLTRIHDDAHAPHVVFLRGRPDAPRASLREETAINLSFLSRASQPRMLLLYVGCVVNGYRHGR